MILEILNVFFLILLINSSLCDRAYIANVIGRSTFHKGRT